MRKQNKQLKTARGRLQAASGQGNLSNIPRPPAYTPTMNFLHKFRFNSSTNAGAFTITRGNLLNMVLVATSAVTTARIFQAVRLRRVEMWTNPVAAGADPVNIFLEWLGAYAPSTVISDLCMGLIPAHIRASPPKASSDMWWSMSGSNESEQLFSMTVEANTVIDVTLEVRLVEQESPTAGDVPAGATLGRLYGDYLDGVTSSKLAPDAYQALP